MDNTPHILVIDDDQRLRRLLRKYLTANGFWVTDAASADEAMPLVGMLAFDLIVLDLMMPGMTGIDMVQALRRTGNKVPVLMLTAMGDVDHRISGLEAGADDYLSKPFEPRELVLRINGILRRVPDKNQSRIVQFGECSFDVTTGALTRAGEAVALTGLETELLRYLVGRAGQAVTRGELMPLMNTDNDRTVDVQMTRLRKKVESDVARPICIQTVRGQGYRLMTK